MEYFAILIAIIIIPLVSQFYINTTYRKFKKIKNTQEMTGFEIAREILDKNGLKDVHVVQTSGNLSDHYDSRRKVIRLSKEIFSEDTIAAISVASHEVGHAIQDKDKYIFLKLRSLLVPIVNIASNIGYIFLVFGFLLEILNLVDIGIIFVASGVVFQIITLPVEYNASKRARNELESLGKFKSSEINDTKKMLNAAALTYVAVLLSSLLQLLRLVLLRGSRD